MAQPDFEVNILPFDPQTAKEMDLRPTLERIYLPEAVFADWAIRTGERTFDAFYRVQDFHCDPLRTPKLRGAIALDGNRVTNSLVIDEEDPEGRPPHTLGHLRKFALYPGHMGFGAICEAASFDQPMDMVAVDSINFKGPGQPGERLLATATIADSEVGRRVISEALVTINRREHAQATKLVFVPALYPKELSLPQFRWLEVIAQLAGAGLQTIIGSLPGGYAVIYDSIGPSIFVPCDVKPDDVLRGQSRLYDWSKLGADRYLFSLDQKLFDGEREIANIEDISLGLMPEEEIMNLIKEALGGAH